MPYKKMYELLLLDENDKAISVYYKIVEREKLGEFVFFKRNNYGYSVFPFKTDIINDAFLNVRDKVTKNPLKFITMNKGTLIYSIKEELEKHATLYGLKKTKVNIEDLPELETESDWELDIKPLVEIALNCLEKMHEIAQNIIKAKIMYGYPHTDLKEEFGITSEEASRQKLKKYMDRLKDCCKKNGFYD